MAEWGGGLEAETSLVNADTEEATGNAGYSHSVPLNGIDGGNMSGADGRRAIETVTWSIVVKAESASSAEEAGSASSAAAESRGSVVEEAKRGSVVEETETVDVTNETGEDRESANGGGSEAISLSSVGPSRQGA